MGDRKAESESFHADADQVDDIKRYAAPYGAEVEFLPPELSISGGLPIEKRPSLLAAVEGVEAGVYTGIVVANLKRLTRSRSGIAIWERVEAAGGRIHCAAENLDTSTVNGRFVRDIHLADAVREREEHVERFERRRQGATAGGVWQRRQTPRGYDRDPETRRLVPDAQADAVLQAARDFMAGATTVELADRLAMTPSGVRYMLRNRVYIGELKVGRHVNPAAHPPIIDLPTFEAVQAKLAARTRPARSGEPSLLIGLVRCASCGHVMTRQSRKGGKAYTCPKRHSGGSCPAPAAIDIGRLESYVEPIARAELRRVWTRIATGSRLAELRVETEAARAERDVFLEAVDAAGIGTSAAAAGMRTRQERVEQAEAAERAELGRIPILPAVKSGDEVWDDLSVHERNTVLRGLLTCVVVRPVGRGQTVPVGERARVLRYGADITLPTSSGTHAAGIVPVWVDADSDDVLGVATGEDTLEGSGGAVEM